MGSYGKRLRIWETNYGREGGWVVERQGQVIAGLTDHRSEEMFWDSYYLEVVTNDADLRQRLQTPDFWASAESEGLVWRSREFGETADGAYAALSPFPEPGRLAVRGLYLAIGAPRRWDRLVLRWRRYGQKHRLARRCS